MRTLQQLEDILENLVEGALVEATAGHIHPVEIAKRLGRALEAGQVVSAGGPVAPNVYTVALSPADFAVLSPIRQSMEQELASYLRALAVERSVRFLTPPRVTVAEDPGLRRRRMKVSAQLADMAPAVVEPRPVMVTARVPVAEVRAALQPRARLTLADGRTVVLQGGIVSAGRNLDNDVVIEDRRVSRHHAQIRYMHKNYCLFDLASANGTRVNGERTDQAVLRDGDLISLGGFDIVFHSTPQEPGRGD